MKKEFSLKIRKINLTIRNLRMKNLRKKKTVKGLMTMLNNANLVSEEICSSFIYNFGHIAAHLFQNELKNNKEVLGSRYTIKEIAISLYFYSPRAYMFIRKHLYFHILLGLLV